MKKGKARNRLGILLLSILFAGGSCTEDDGFENIDQPCFTKESLETVPWIVDEIKKHALPNGGGYSVAVYIYHDQQFLAITTPFGCTPIGEVFNCTGVRIDSLGIDHNDFQDNRKLAVILTGTK